MYTLTHLPPTSGLSIIVPVDTVMKFVTVSLQLHSVNLRDKLPNCRNKSQVVTLLSRLGLLK
jgi:hypothetical protein